MEELDGSNRQSGILSLINREKVDRINTERPMMAMATTAVVSPTSSMYSNGPSPYSSGWSGPAAYSVSGLISPPESRRTSDNKTEPPPPIQTSQPHRQSLPSIHEALSNGPKPNPYASPVSASLPVSHQIPYSQPQSAPLPRAYPPSDHAQYPPQLAPSQTRQPSPPHPVHPQPNFSRPEQSASSFPEVSRHPSITSLQAAPGPHNPYAAPRYEPARHEQDPRAQERIPNGYPPHPPPPQQPAYNYGPNPNQIPPPPGQQVSIYNQSRYPPRDPRELADPWKGEKQEPVSFRQGVKRHLDVWDFENNLAEINISSSALHEWSAHYNAIAQEQQRPVSSLPERMPTLESVEDMLRHSLKISNALSNMQNIIRDQQDSLREQRMRDQGVRGPGEYEDEMSMYGDDMKNHGYGSEGRKRRGRAAPPGRCHSCNRAETPEWRRGPDGARTLCNACGLHYAKLTRKNTMRQSQGLNGSSLRPRSRDDNSPRPLM
ncbi:uncharacterized protein LY89DRAFT_746068 [Mollisia scopiformis]|uniref:GATA-type domain-containing protein n=1 Tax=Mollisia scopiformis TaxID=149040 RepID=A0A194XCW1_MOLSC|nr:uncharacterized protein LY89DRAFT_746068 [Mollisia scopiformis]KUJ18008.1 hypothetical protein LY89DRAFT_746068 [Mollisia scopiformis]